MRVIYLFLLLFAVLLVSSCSVNQDTHRITITPEPPEAGTVTPSEGDFEVGRTLEIGAYPNEHWTFQRWEGDQEGTKNPMIISIDSDKDIAAVFAKRDYPLTITIQGEGTVTETVVQQKVTDYEHGTVVELLANATEGWEFAEWRGDLQGTENPATVTIDGETAITAVFERVQYPLTVNVEGEGTVSETVVQAKTTDYPFGTTVQLTAEPDSSWAFFEWSGDVESTENPVEITVDGPKTVTATFMRSFTLTTISVPEQGGTITPAGGEYIRDTSFQVEAIPNEGWEFSEWRGDFTGTINPFNLTMNGNKTIEAHFDPIVFTVQTNVEGSGEILVDLFSGSETADGFIFGSEVELTASPSAGWRFVRWQGDLTGSANPAIITIDGNKSVTAIFSFFDDGDGTPENPYQISTLDQLQMVQNYPDSHFILMANIDASATSAGEGFDPIGDEATPFAGSFNGNGFEISNLSINRPGEQYVGLFGYTTAGSQLQNVQLLSASITGGMDTGILAGLNNGDIIESRSTGAVNGSDNVGGLVGQNSGSIQRSLSNATTSGTDNIGGLVGNNSSTIMNSNALGSVSGNDNVGGLAGLNANSGSISLTYAAGPVSASFTAGGLVGLNSGSVESSYWDTETTTQASGAGSGDTTGMTGLTENQMRGDDAATNMTDLDFDTIWSTSPIGYPVLQWLNE